MRYNYVLSVSLDLVVFVCDLFVYAVFVCVFLDLWVFEGCVCGFWFLGDCLGETNKGGVGESSDLFVSSSDFFF